MTTAAPTSAGRLSGLGMLAAAALVAAGLAGAGLWWEPWTAGPAGADGDPPPTPVRRALPRPVPEGAFHSVRYRTENGVPVVLIQTVAGGDVLVVDRDTGRLIESRPAPR